MKVLEVRGLEKSFSKGFIPRRQQVLKGVNFSIQAGRITGFLGANGAGKTTTMKCFLGLVFPDSGECRYFNNQELNSSIKQKIGFLPERPYFYEYLTGKEFLLFYGQLSTSLSRKDILLRIDKLLKRVDLLHAKDKHLRDYSKGMLQKIGLAQALIHEPELVILDEPMAGLDPDGRYYLSEMIREVAQKGASVFFSSHLLHDAESLCQDLVILKDGAVVYEGSTQQLLDQSVQEVRVSYADQNNLNVLVVESLDQAQIEIKRLLDQGASIQEVRRQRKTLEEIFVDMALRSNKQT